MTDEEIEVIARFVRTEAAFWSAWLLVEMFADAMETLGEDVA
jgi:hypothetical protein